MGGCIGLAQAWLLPTVANIPCSTGCTCLNVTKYSIHKPLVHPKAPLNFNLWVYLFAWLTLSAFWEKIEYPLMKKKYVYFCFLFFIFFFLLVTMMNLWAFTCWPSSSWKAWRRGWGVNWARPYVLAAWAVGHLQVVIQQLYAFFIFI